MLRAARAHLDPRSVSEGTRGQRSNDEGKQQMSTTPPRSSFFPCTVEPFFSCVFSLFSTEKEACHGSDIIGSGSIGGWVDMV